MTMNCTFSLTGGKEPTYFDKHPGELLRICQHGYTMFHITITIFSQLRYELPSHFPHPQCLPEGLPEVRALLQLTVVRKCVYIISLCRVS